MIKHQVQCDPKGCVSACIAMLLNRQVEEVTAEFHDDYHSGRRSASHYMTSNGIRFVAGDPEGGLEWGKIYMLGVPSLNLKGIMHAIIADLSDGDEVKIFDPNEGYSGRLFYDMFGKDPGSHALMGFRIDYEILWCPAMGEDAS